MLQDASASRLAMMYRLWPASGVTAFLPKWRMPIVVSDMPATLCRSGSLEVRLAQSKSDVKRAQRLRYKVFYKQGSAIADAATKFARRDVDRFDAVCDHILVLDHSKQDSRGAKIVGTYRLLRQEVANQHGGFYTADEFEMDALIERHRHLRFVELGRSCVLPAYRNTKTAELLWQGVWAYVRHHKIDVMIGCASLDGTDARKLALPLSFLHHYSQAPAEWRAHALPHRGLNMDLMAKEAIDPKAALRSLPPLVKGYLRLGAYIGKGAVVDHQFGTIDILIVLPVSAISSRYLEHFGETRQRQRLAA